MAKRIAFPQYILGIALFAAFGVCYSAQDTVPPAATKKDATVQAAAPAAPVPSASQDTTKKPAAAANTAETKPASPGKPAQSLQKKKTAGEDILDEEDLILPEKGVDLPAKKAAAEAPANGVETAPAGTASTPEKAGPGGTASQPGAPAAPNAVSSPSSPAPSAAPNPAPSAAAATAAAPAAKPVTIEDARPINFARNLKDYRSPKLAMLLSLVVPGLGQAYVGKPFNYFKAGAFIAVEAAIIGVSAYYNNKGNTRYNQAKNYANSYYSYDSMVGYYNQLLNFLEKDPSNNMPETLAYEKLNEIYIDTLGTATSSFTKFYNKNHPSQDYYHTIGNSEYIHGWKGCEPSLDEIGRVASGDTLIDNPAYRYRYQRAPDSAGNYLVNIIDRTTGQVISAADYQLQYGYSPYQRDYNTMINESNKFYKTATYVLFVILINHVASAVDALISARSYNNWLLGRQTFWDKISLQPTTAFSGQYLSPGLTMSVRF
jgi:hypothetical protein